MRYLLIVKPKVKKELEKIPKKDRIKIINGLVSLEKDPFLGKKLKGEYDDSYSLRIWPYRIIYKIFSDKLIIIVIRIGHRQGVY